MQQTVPTSVSFTSNWSTQYFAIWVDFNDDGDFSDSGEHLWSSPTNAWSSTVGSITIPSPSTNPHSSRVIPEGSRWNFRTLSPRTTVCPALLPPWNLATHVALSANLSTSLPFPSSPHWAPSTTVAGMVLRPSADNIVHELCASVNFR